MREANDKEKKMRPIRTFCALLLFLASSMAAAANYTLWINGRAGGAVGAIGNYNDFSYWGPATTPAGGSELSDAGSWTTSEPLVQDLKTATARAMYNHNDTRNIWFYMYAGARGTLYSGLLPGQDDEVIAYHSSGGVAGSSGRSLCNPGDWFCNDLTLGTANNQGGSAKWSHHSVLFRDDGEDYNHYMDGNWGGVVSVVRNAVVNTAQ